jgi:hypothetical protein
VQAAAEQVPLSREQALWDDEVSRLLAAVATLEPAARRAVTAVLKSLVDDPTESAGTHRDVRALLGALDAGAALGPLLRDANIQDGIHVVGDRSTVRSLPQRILDAIEDRGYQAGLAAGR